MKRNLSVGAGVLKKTCGAILAACLLPVLLCGRGEAMIRDLRDLSQEPLAYVDPAAADRPLIPAGDQERLHAEFDSLHFEPWRQEVPRHRLDQVLWGFRKYAGKPGYGRDGRRHPPDWIRKMEANARLDEYPQGGFPAVTVRRTDVRRLPTREPHSLVPRSPGDGHPFDNLQESSVPAGSPIRVLHVSRDRRWCLAETSDSLGWIPSEAVASVKPEMIRSWVKVPQVVIVRDKSPVRDGKGKIRFRASLGSLCPKTGEDEKGIRIWTAARGDRGEALLREAWLPEDAAAAMPLPMTPRRVAQVAGEMAGEPYGWGGLGGKRDCSAMIRDLFSPFGLWLPRNSGDQALYGRFESLRGLSPAEKEARIIRDGVPWRTLLWTPGHIMLYIGLHQGRPLIFHNFWSVKTRDAQGKQDRVIVGRAAVTTLHPGRELPGADRPGGDILSGLEGMSLLGIPSDSREEGTPR